MESDKARLRPIQSSGVSSPEKQIRAVLRIPNWADAFDLLREELEMILERNVLPATFPEFLTVRRMFLGLNSPMMVPSVQAREVVERQQRAFTQG